MANKKADVKVEKKDDDLYKITTHEGLVIKRKWSNLNGPKYDRLIKRGWKVEKI